MVIELLGAAAPLYFYGESHCLGFTNQLFRVTPTGQNYQCRVRFFPELLAVDYCKGDVVAAELTAALIADGLLTKDLQPAFKRMTASTAALSDVTPAAPLLIFFAGDMDVHHSLKQLGLAYDFLLPDDPGYGVEQGKQILPFAAMRDFINTIYAPFFQALLRLQALGFDKIMVHGLPARTTDPAHILRWVDVSVSAALRAKFTVLANRLLDERCTAHGFGFIDIWPETTDGLYLKPEYVLDGVHLGRAAVPITLDKIASFLAINGTVKITAK